MLPKHPFGTDGSRSQNQKPNLFLLLRIKALDWEAATVGVGCNPLIASLDAFYARWKCTRRGRPAPASWESARLVCTISPSTTVSSRPRCPSKAEPYLDDLLHH